MAKYLSEADALAAGFTITHEPESARYALYEGDTLKGWAHYSLRDGALVFDHTEVDPSLRGTGLSGVLANRAFTDAFAGPHRVVATCSFMVGYLARHPELAEPQG